ncbi:MAG TPA: hypothetical protein VM935_18435 [Chitinophagaceae bacterium]|jgi:flagellin-specific chaperone FliS|nr:hypothetical protein [Chitinophagaceae bacterium]
MHNYSPEELIQYLYNETSSQTTAAIELALQQDWTLREKLSVLKASAERLNSIVETPRTEIILSILKYASKEETISSK